MMSLPVYSHVPSRGGLPVYSVPGGWGVCFKRGVCLQRGVSASPCALDEFVELENFRKITCFLNRMTD